MMVGTHVDDLVILATKEQYQWFSSKILTRFKTTFDGPVRKLLGMAIERPTPSSYRLHQQTAIMDLAREQGLDTCKPTLLPYDPSIPIDQISTEHSDDADTGIVRSILGSVNYFVTMTCPEVAYALNRLQRHAHRAKLEHLAQARHLVRYLATEARANRSGLTFEGEAKRWRKPPNDGLLKIAWNAVTGDGKRISCDAHIFNLNSRLEHGTVAYSDSDWAADVDDRRSYESSIVKQAGAAVWWRATKATLVGLSTAETEADAAVATCKGALFVAGIAKQMRTPPCQWVAHSPPSPIPIYVDNQAAITILSKETRGRNRHVDVRLKFLQNGMHHSMFNFPYIPSADNDADIGTKLLPLAIFRKLRDRVTGKRADADIAAVLNAMRAHYTQKARSVIRIPDVRQDAEHGGVSDHPKITQYSRSPSTRSLSVTQESPDSVHDMIDVAHAYIHHAVDQMYQSPPPLMREPENLQNTKAMHAHQSDPTQSQSAMR